METLWHDTRYALRSLAKSPAYAALSVLTLALGIGANTAIFSVVNGVLLKPLGYPHPEQLEFISSTFPKLNFDRFWLDLPEWSEFKQWNRAYQDVGGFRPRSANLGTPDHPRRVTAMLVTPELMNVLGVRPLPGPPFPPAGGASRGAMRVPGAKTGAVGRYSRGHGDLGGDETVLGRVIPIDGPPPRIVGIMPRGYDTHDERIELFLPLTIDPKTFANSRG